MDAVIPNKGAIMSGDAGNMAAASFDPPMTLLKWETVLTPPVSTTAAPVTSVLVSLVICRAHSPRTFTAAVYALPGLRNVVTPRIQPTLSLCALMWAILFAETKGTVTAAVFWSHWRLNIGSGGGRMPTF